jgi:hypothetical protein
MTIGQGGISLREQASKGVFVSEEKVPHSEDVFLGYASFDISDGRRFHS